MQKEGVYLASSALIKKGFEGGATIEAALEYGFDGVQLFLDPRYRDDEYAEKIRDRVKATRLGVLIHLPNEPNDSDLRAAGILARGLPEARLLIHYLPATELPIVRTRRGRAAIGWENSVIGFDTAHLAEVLTKARLDRTFMVFDAGRLMYLGGGLTKRAILEAAEVTMTHLEPGQDVLHLADKTSWYLSFRDSMCEMGHPRGISNPLIPTFVRFIGAGGAVVLEHENLNMAVNSIPALRR